MTCIVGITDGRGKLVMGADSIIVTNGWECSNLKHPKVFRVGEMLIGVSGNLRLLQIVEHQFKPAEMPPGEDGMHYMVCVFIPALKKALEEFGFIEYESGTCKMNGNLLVGLRGELYTITLDFGVQEDVNGYDVIGSGTSHALGSLFSTGNWDLQTRVRLALQAAAKFDAAVRGPFTIVEAVGEHQVFS